MPGYEMGKPLHAIFSSVVGFVYFVLFIVNNSDGTHVLEVNKVP